ncbi:MAG: hypothetical protein KatS3mg023_2295 [Armatimonadota bacterium]|nr:MAG: hypothetical protein KatS3mg023_2295 [Armatimonadota bacterium]
MEDIRPYGRYAVPVTRTEERAQDVYEAIARLLCSSLQPASREITARRPPIPRNQANSVSTFPRLHQRLVPPAQFWVALNRFLNLFVNQARSGAQGICR